MNTNDYKIISDKIIKICNGHTYMNDPKLHKKLVKALKEYDFKKLGSGVYRTGFGNDDVVFKIGRDSANQQELDIYNDLKDHPILQYLICPILTDTIMIDDEHSIIFSKRCKKANFFYNDHYQIDIDPSCEYMTSIHVKQMNLIHSIFCDMHLENVGIYECRVVGFDFNCEETQYITDAIANFPDMERAFEDAYGIEIACTI